MDERFAEERSALRTAGRAARGAVTGEVRRLATATVVRRLAGLPELLAARHVLLTRAVGTELDLAELESVLRASGVTVALPRVVGDGIEVVDLTTESELAPGWQGVLEPQGPASTDPLDAVVVPALVLDRAGNRLGYGGGHFDRLLADTARGAVTIGAVLHAQLVDAVPHATHDVPLDVVVTERGVWRPHATRAVR